VKYPSDMDRECVELCDALNAMIGVQTTESCCGHGTHPYRIFFNCVSFSSLYQIARAAGHELWRIECQYWNGSDALGFILEGPKMKVLGRGVIEGWLADLIDELQRR